MAHQKNAPNLILKYRSHRASGQAVVTCDGRVSNLARMRRSKAAPRMIDWRISEIRRPNWSPDNDTP